jgi:hypothetical protein
MVAPRRCFDVSRAERAFGFRAIEEPSAHHRFLHGVPALRIVVPRYAFLNMSRRPPIN